MKNPLDDIGVVVIGRNEGDRLKRCLLSILNQIGRIVYVDSGSSDRSMEIAEHLGIVATQLDMRFPFSAGRARNEGFKHLTQNNNNLRYIQFIDGDCELCNGWLSFAYNFLESEKTCALVAGRRKERYPEQSTYNLLCDIEWNTPIGETKQCGGDFMIRRSAFEDVGGFNPNVVAGEEPEMCYRLREKNWSIIRLDHPMTLHDAAIKYFYQWWKRSIRTGHAYAQGYALHSHDGQKFCLKNLLTSWFWALIFPIAILTLSLTIDIKFLLLLIVYMIQLIKIAAHTYKHLGRAKHSLMYGFFTVMGKFPQLIGQLLFLKRNLSREKNSIIEYK